MKIDSHVHISWMQKKKSFEEIRKDLFFNMAKNGIDRSVIIPDNVPNPQCAGLDNVIELIKNQDKLYSIGTLKVEEVDKVGLEKIKNLFDRELIRGFKIFPGHDPVYPTDSRWKPIYELCIEYKFPLIVHTGINTGNEKVAKYNDPKHIVKVSSEYPNLKIIIAHYFWPKLEYCFNITNDCKNIYFDTSALADPEVINTCGGTEKIRDILEKTMKRNSKSVIFGTDWPICNARDNISLINSLNISPKNKEEIFYENAIKIFRL